MGRPSALAFVSSSATNCARSGESAIGTMSSPRTASLIYYCAMSPRKFILLNGIAALLFVGTFGTTIGASMMNANGHMSGCPLMGVPTGRHMSPLDHAFTLQNMLATIPFSGVFASFVLFLLALAMVALITPTLWSSIGNFIEPLLEPPARAHRYIPRHTLQEAFSNGVLHSRAF